MSTDIDHQFWLSCSEKADDNYIEQYLACARDNTQAYQKLEEEQSTILSAARKALARENYQAVLEIENCLWSGGGRWLDLRGHTQSGITLLTQAIEAARLSGDKRREEHLLGQLGRAWMKREDLSKARLYLQQALNIADEIGDLEGKASHLGILGHIDLGQGEEDQAVQRFEEALSIARETGDRQTAGRLSASLGTISLMTDRTMTLDTFRDKVRSFERNLRVVREEGDRQGEASHLGCLGLAWELVVAGFLAGPNQVTLARGPYFSEFDRRHQEYREKQEKENERYKRLLGNYRKPLRYYEQALGIAREIGDWELEKHFEQEIDRVCSRIHPITASRNVLLQTARTKEGQARYVTAMAEDRGWVLRAETIVAKEWERFTLLCLHNDKIAFKTYHGRYVTAMNGESDRDWRLIAETNVMGVWEMFYPIDLQSQKRLSCSNVLARLEQGSLTIVLKAHHGKYVTAMGEDREWVLRAGTEDASECATFTLSIV
jgi:tetratricopeptide (TPR) repeat protein